MNREIYSLVLDLAEIAAWPEAVSVLERAITRPHQVWEWPVLACRAVGGQTAAAWPAAAAIAAAQLSILMIDDILDDDPRGAHHRLGAGGAANLAAALQAAGPLAAAQADWPDPVRVDILRELAQMTLATAFGQYLDAQSRPEQEHYWRVVRTKSSPFYGAALYVGARAGGAEPDAAQGLRALGLLSGEIVQLYDDFEDALQTPANPDWKRGWNNLLILFARTAEHSQRVRLEELLRDLHEPAALKEAQGILVSSGAVSYCAYQLIRRLRQAQEMARTLHLPHPEVIQELLGHQAQPLRLLWEGLNLPLPPELAEI